jgi:uncharacterized repeat protein (TIGR01451 family)
MASAPARGQDSVAKAADDVAAEASAQPQTPPRACVPLRVPDELCLEKTVSPDPATVGEPITFTITVINNHPSDLEAPTSVFDDLPAGVTFVSATSRLYNCSPPPPGSNTVSCEIDHNAPTEDWPQPRGGPGAPITIVVLPTVSGTFTNTARDSLRPAGGELNVVQVPFTVLAAPIPMQGGEATATAYGTMARAGGS